MYRLIIVDDEMQSREILKTYINNFDIGYEIVGIFKNGAEAIDYLKENKVDVVVSDIKMPVMSGIELSKWICENRPDIKVVLVSAFADFEFARTAMSYGVIYYLLKVICEEELYEVLIKVKEVLDESKAEIDELEGGNYELLQQLYCAIALDEATLSSIENIYNQLKTKIPFSDAYIFLYKLNIVNFSDVYEFGWAYGKPAFSSALSNVVRLSNESNLTFVGFVSYDEAILITISTNEQTENETKNILHNIYQIFHLKIEIELIGNDKIDSIKNPGYSGEAVDRIKKMFLLELNDARTDQLAEKMRNFMEENYMRDISRDDLANFLGLNSTYVSRLFKEKIGITFLKYLSNLRMSKAVKMMQDNVKFNEISKRVGYNNPKQFSRAFKLYSGYSPGDYRKNILKL